MNLQHSYLEKQHDSLKDASQPKKEELKQLDELKKIISGEEKKIDKLIEGSKQLKAKAGKGQKQRLILSILIPAALRVKTAAALRSSLLRF